MGAKTDNTNKVSLNLDEGSSNLKNLHTFMQVYNIFMALMYICATLCVGTYTVLFVVAAVSGDTGWSGSSFQGESYTMLLMYGVLFAGVTVFMLIFAAGYLYLTTTVSKRNMTNFVLQIIGLALGLSSFLTMIPAIVLLVFWIMDENRQYMTAKPEKYGVGGSDNDSAGAVSLSDGLDEINTKTAVKDKDEVVKLKTAEKNPRQVASSDLDGDK